LWLVHQLLDVEIRLTPDRGGFTARLRAGPPPPAAPAAGGCPLRAGTLNGTRPDAGTVHAIDGDGSSLCEVVAAGDLRPVDDLHWPDLPAGQQCPRCRLVIDADHGSSPAVTGS
jgi:hypothetical protein